MKVTIQSESDFKVLNYINEKMDILIAENQGLLQVIDIEK